MLTGVCVLRVSQFYILLFITFPLDYYHCLVSCLVQLLLSSSRQPLIYWKASHTWIWYSWILKGTLSNQLARGFLNTTFLMILEEDFAKRERIISLSNSWAFLNYSKWLKVRWHILKILPFHVYVRYCIRVYRLGLFPKRVMVLNGISKSALYSLRRSTPVSC